MELDKDWRQHLMKLDDKVETKEYEVKFIYSIFVEAEGIEDSIEKAKEKIYEGYVSLKDPDEIEVIVYGE